MLTPPLLKGNAIEVADEKYTIIVRSHAEINVHKLPKLAKVTFFLLFFFAGIYLFFASSPLRNANSMLKVCKVFLMIF